MINAGLISTLIINYLQHLQNFISFIKFQYIWVLSNEIIDIWVDLDQMFVDVTCELWPRQLLNVEKYEQRLHHLFITHDCLVSSFTQDFSQEVVEEGFV